MKAVENLLVGCVLGTGTGWAFPWWGTLSFLSGVCMKRDLFVWGILSVDEHRDRCLPHQGLQPSLHPPQELLQGLDPLPKLPFGWGGGSSTRAGSTRSPSQPQKHRNHSQTSYPLQALPLPDLWNEAALTGNPWC